MALDKNKNGIPGLSCIILISHVKIEIEFVGRLMQEDYSCLCYHVGYQYLLQHLND